MSTIRQLRQQVTAQQSTIDTLEASLAAINAAVISLQGTMTPPTALDVSGAVDIAMDAWLAASGDFQQGHTGKGMELPLGAQNASNAQFFCPSGQWAPESVSAFINGVALPDKWVRNRSASSFHLGGGLPISMWPDTTIPERREMRVTYDNLPNASGLVTPSGLIALRISEIEFSGIYPSGIAFDVESSASGTLVVTDPSFDWPEDLPSFAFDNNLQAHMNGSLLRKETAGAWVPLEAYGVGDRVFESNIIYQANTLHYASGTWPPTLAYWDAVASNDLLWVNGSGAKLAFDAEPEDYIYIEAPEYL